MTTRRPALTIRAHLTLVYAITFALAVTVLTTAACLLTVSLLTPAQAAPPLSTGAPSPVPSAIGPGQDANLLPGSVVVVLSVLALGVIVAAALGWVVAGRVLSPIRRITATAREIAARDLRARVALAGPHDEIQELADTFDGMLARLQRSFEAQRRFAANASHELLTPLTTGRAILEVAAANPAKCDVRLLTELMLAVNRQSEQLVDALLALARAEHGVVSTKRVDLALIAERALQETGDEAWERDVAVDVVTEPAPMDGDPALLELLALNVLRNAFRHNRPGGHARVRVRRHGDGPELVVANSGPEVPAELLDELFEPFVRAAPRTTGGHGLGMAIIHAVAEAHRGTVTAEANPGGGLTVTIRFPAPNADETSLLTEWVRPARRLSPPGIQQ